MRELVFALDADAAGQQPWRQHARQAALRGKRVAGVPPEAYGGYKDANAAWVAGALTIGGCSATMGEGPEGYEMPEALRDAWAERVAIMVSDGHLPPAEAERLAWAGLRS